MLTCITRSFCLSHSTNRRSFDEKRTHRPFPFLTAYRKQTLFLLPLFYSQLWRSCSPFVSIYYSWPVPYPCIRRHNRFPSIGNHRWTSPRLDLSSRPSTSLPSSYPPTLCHLFSRALDFVIPLINAGSSTTIHHLDNVVSSKATSPPWDRSFHPHYLPLNPVLDRWRSKQGSSCRMVECVHHVWEVDTWNVWTTPVSVRRRRSSMDRSVEVSSWSVIHVWTVANAVEIWITPVSWTWHVAVSVRVCSLRELIRSLWCPRFMMYWLRLVEGSPPAPTGEAIVVGGLPDGSSGSSLSALSGPLGIALGSDQSLYVADSSNNRVIKLPAGSLTGKVVAGTGIAGSGLNQLNRPTGVNVDPSLNVYVLDSNNYRVMLWLRNASVGTRVAGSGSSGSTLNSIAAATGLYVDSQGYIFVSDTNNHRVLRWAPNATNAVVVAGTGVPGGDNSGLSSPCGIDYDEASSYLYVADYGNDRIQRFAVGFSTTGTTVAGGYGAGSGANQFNSPQSVYASRTSNNIYITDSGNNRIQRWVSQTFSGTTIVGFGATNANYSYPVINPADLKLSSNEQFVFVSEAAGNRVLHFKTT